MTLVGYSGWWSLSGGDVAVLDVQNSVVVIRPVQVVVGDMHWSVLEVHVQDVGAALHVLDNERVVCEDQACVEDQVPAGGK